eukprot:5553052-Alexandrium_andersonii.AAC.1
MQRLGSARLASTTTTTFGSSFWLGQAVVLILACSPMFWEQQTSGVPRHSSEAGGVGSVVSPLALYLEFQTLLG